MEVNLETYPDANTCKQNKKQNHHQQKQNDDTTKPNSKEKSQNTMSYLYHKCSSFESSSSGCS